MISTDTGLARLRVSERALGLTSRVVTELVNVETVLPGCETAHRTRHFRLSSFLQYVRSRHLNYRHVEDPFGTFAAAKIAVVVGNLLLEADVALGYVGIPSY